MIGSASFNPTKLTVGQTGSLDGHTVTVVGRATLSSAEGYRWYEYYLSPGGGKMIVLVFERGVWKRFDEFTPEVKLSVADAAATGVGDFVHVTGDGCRVNYASTSTVLFGEGTLLEGERKGSQARYFNAENGGDMVVVSWTGDEIEYYRGKKIPGFVIRHAFNLPQSSLVRRFFAVSDPSAIWTAVVLCGFGVLVGAFLIDSAFSSGRSGLADPAPVVPPPTERLPLGAQGTLDGAHYVIAGHWLEQIDEQGERFVRDEYALNDDQGRAALLVEGLTGSPHQWCLLHPGPAPADLSPLAAAKIKSGGSLPLGGRPLLAQALFRSRTLGKDGDGAQGRLVGGERYGWVAHAPAWWALARWTELDLELEQGPSVPEADVLSAFGPLRPR